MRTPSSGPFDTPGFCYCGCGERTNKVPYALTAHDGHRYRNGEHYRFVTKHAKRVPVIEEDRGYKTPCWIYTGVLTPGGYALDGKGRRLHRVNYEAKHGEIPAEQQLDHLCRVRNCIHPDHVEPVTSTVNVRRGDVTKLTEDSVREIRFLVEQGMTQTEAARRFGVKQPTVSDIIHYRTWQDVH